MIQVIHDTAGRAQSGVRRRGTPVPLRRSVSTHGGVAMESPLRSRPTTVVSPVVALSAALALFLSSPALAALSTPSFLPGDTVIGPAAGLQEQPSVAAGGAGSLVVWADARTSLIPLAAFSGGPFL